LGGEFSLAGEVGLPFGLLFLVLVVIHAENRADATALLVLGQRLVFGFLGFLLGVVVFADFQLEFLLD